MQIRIGLKGMKVPNCCVSITHIQFHILVQLCFACAIDGGGVKLNGEKVGDTNLELATVGEYIVQIGKRRFARILVA